VLPRHNQECWICESVAVLLVGCCGGRPKELFNTKNLREMKEGKLQGLCSNWRWHTFMHSIARRLLWCETEGVGQYKKSSRNEKWETSGPVQQSAITKNLREMKNGKSQGLFRKWRWHTFTHRARTSHGCFN